jgi:conjugal transfer pilin signal peptidase TrbI
MSGAEPVRFDRARRWALLAGVGACAATWAALADFSSRHALLINVSPSLPYWALWVDKARVPKRGETIVFMPPPGALVERHFGREPHPFGKRIWGMPGDTVSREGRTFYVNDRPVAIAKAVSRIGEPLAVGPTGTIPRGCYFVGTEHKDGLDSRYAAIGWVCGKQILGIARPVL